MPLDFLQLSISGYNHKLPVLLDAILDKLVALEVRAWRVCGRRGGLGRVIVYK